MIIKPENTSIANGVAQGVRVYLKRFTRAEVSTPEPTKLDAPSEFAVLDYACGAFLRNTLYILSQGYTDVSVLDVEAQYRRIDKALLSRVKGAYTPQFLPDRKYDLIFNNFVLNVIPDIEVRAEVITNIAKLLKDDGGRAVFEVRSKEDIFTGKYIEPFKDGYLMGKNTVKTFQKAFEMDELVGILERYGFSILEKKKTAGSYIVFVGKKVAERSLFGECASVA